MFKVRRKRFSDPNRQIPYTLYESLQENAPRRRARALLEVVLVAAAVLGLAFGTAAIYKHLNDSKQNNASQTTVQQTPNTNAGGKSQKDSKNSPAQHDAQNDNAPSVTQAPQVNKNTAAPTTEPSVTPQSHSTNSGTVHRPR